MTIYILFFHVIARLEQPKQSCGTQSFMQEIATPINWLAKTKCLFSFRTYVKQSYDMDLYVIASEAKQSPDTTSYFVKDCHEIKDFSQRRLVLQRLPRKSYIFSGNVYMAYKSISFLYHFIVLKITIKILKNIVIIIFTQLFLGFPSI